MKTVTGLHKLFQSAKVVEKGLESCLVCKLSFHTHVNILSLLLGPGCHEQIRCSENCILDMLHP